MTLARPHSYMNLSGGPVAALLGFTSFPPNEWWLSTTSSMSPSAGCASSSAAATTATTACAPSAASLGTRDYYRARFGIGRPPGRMDAAAFVLKDFSAAERKELPFALDRCADAVEALITKGLAEAQNEYHTRPAPVRRS